MKYRRVLLKLSGEALGGNKGLGISQKEIERICAEIKEIVDIGVEVGIVVGGGNIFRGLSEAAKDMDRTVADDMGMLATVINGLALKDGLRREGVKSCVMSAVKIDKMCEFFSADKARDYLSSKKVVIFVAGTGNPFFTTDTAAALRALEIGADVFLKATKVSGIYSKDPKKFNNAVFYERLTYMEVIEKNLKVMDLTAISLCRENNLPIVVFNLLEKGNLKRVILGERIGTLVEGG